MPATEHTFPLPEPETHKLDYLQYSLETPPRTSAPQSANQSTSTIASKWPLLAFAGIGVAAAMLWRLRSK